MTLAWDEKSTHTFLILKNKNDNLGINRVIDNSTAVSSLTIVPEIWTQMCYCKQCHINLQLCLLVSSAWPQLELLLAASVWTSLVRFDVLKRKISWQCKSYAYYERCSTHFYGWYKFYASLHKTATVTTSASMSYDSFPGSCMFSTLAYCLTSNVKDQQHRVSSEMYSGPDWSM